jgi:hypothetical protein
MGLVDKRFITAVFMLVTCSFVVAQDQQASQPSDDAPPSVSAQRPIEQIDVIGERTLLTMRNEIVREEESLYRLFNDLNSADKFDIFCKSERSTASFIKLRSCEPEFLKLFRQQSSRFALTEMRQAFGEDGLDLTIFLNGLDLLESDGEIRQQLVGDYDAMQEEMFRIAMENPDYLASLQKVAELRAVYGAARDERFGRD